MQRFEEELEEKKSDLISLVGVAAVVSSEPNELGKRLKELEEAIEAKKV